MLIIYDTETTGLIKHPDAPLDKQPRIIEFGAAALSLKSGKPVARISQLIDPGEPISAEVTRITSITNDDVKGKPSFKAAWTKTIAPFLAKATGMLAHNEPFDHAVLGYELQRHALSFTWPAVHCTIGLYRAEWGRDMKLPELYEQVVGKSLDQKHRAGSDVDALTAIVQKAKLWQVLL